MTVIDGGIEYVDSRTQRQPDGFCVCGIGCIVRLTEIGSQAEGREPQFVSGGNVFCVTKEFCFAELREALAVAGSAFRSGES